MDVQHLSPHPDERILFVFYQFRTFFSAASLLLKSMKNSSVDEESWRARMKCVWWIKPIPPHRSLSTIHIHISSLSLAAFEAYFICSQWYLRPRSTLMCTHNARSPAIIIHVRELKETKSQLDFVKRQERNSKSQIVMNSPLSRREVVSRHTRWQDSVQWDLVDFLPLPLNLCTAQSVLTRAKKEA